MEVRMPGICGMGECVLCGDSFAISTWLGESISLVLVDGFDVRLPMHNKCSKTFEDMIGKDWTDLPEGPLRKEFAASFATA
jgi:hypothetical protein